MVRGVFGDMARNVLAIPAFIHDYNFNMGGVDIAHQLRSYYSVQQRIQHNSIYIRSVVFYIQPLLNIQTPTNGSKSVYLEILFWLTGLIYFNHGPQSPQTPVTRSILRAPSYISHTESFQNPRPPIQLLFCSPLPQYIK